MESIRNEFPEKNVNKLLGDMNAPLQKFASTPDKITEDVRDKWIRGMIEMIKELCYIMLKYDIGVDISCVPKEICEEVRKGFPEKSYYEFAKETIGLACERVSNVFGVSVSNLRERKVSEFMKELCELMHKYVYSDMVPCCFVFDNWICSKKELSNDIHKYVIFSSHFNIDEAEAESMSRDIPYANPLDYSNFKEWWENHVGENDVEMDKKYMDIAVKTLFSFCPTLTYLGAR